MPGPIQTAGLVLATLGVAISSIRRGPGGTEAMTAHRLRPSTCYGLLGALGFGTLFLAMAEPAAPTSRGPCSHPAPSQWRPSPWRPRWPPQRAVAPRSP